MKVTMKVTIEERRERTLAALRAALEDRRKAESAVEAAQARVRDLTLRCAGLAAQVELLTELAAEAAEAAEAPAAADMKPGPAAPPDSPLPPVPAPSAAEVPSA